MRKIEVSKNRYIVVFNCDYCNEQHETSWSHYSLRKRHFCSPECYHDFQKWCLPKKEHSRYGCGHTPEERALRKKCRSILNHAIRDGKIKRDVCKKCGDPAEAHHPDYKKPLEVEWLCFKHHRKEHATARREQNKK